MARRTCIVAVLALWLAPLASSIAGGTHWRGQQSSGVHATVPASVPVGQTNAPRASSALQPLAPTFIEGPESTSLARTYWVPGRDKSWCFTSTGITLLLDAPLSSAAETPGDTGRQPAALDAGGGAFSKIHRAESNTQAWQRWTLQMEFVGANPQLQPSGQDAAPTLVSFFQGPREQWKTGLRSYRRLVYSEVWPGIDLVYSGAPGVLKYEFVLKPGADASRIRLRYHGASQVRLRDTGQLSIVTPWGDVLDDPPSAYQPSDDERTTPVPAAYVLESGVDANNQTVGFRVGSYDSTQTLVIDPAVLIYCGLFGGSRADLGNAIAVDSAGSVYVTGWTNSFENSFPVAGGMYRRYSGNGDAFVAKLSADGSYLVYCGYIGGSADDSGLGIAVDQGGKAYVVGHTKSTRGSFPVTRGPELEHRGLDDAWVAKVNAAGTDLLYCGYIGGNGDDVGHAIAVDSTGSAYITGWSNSSGSSFPVKGGPSLVYNGGSAWGDAFIAKVEPSGLTLDYCGYIGGDADDAGLDIAVDAIGRAVVVGDTWSDQASFPVAGGPSLKFGGGSDAFVAQVQVSGVVLLYCGYIGGNRDDLGNGIALDHTGCAYVTGWTASAPPSFPVLVGPDLTFHGGPQWGDVFIAKVQADGAGLAYCGYIGGSEDDRGWDVAVDDLGNAYVTGCTASTQASFPVSSGPDLTHNGGSWDAFVAQVDPVGSGLAYAGYIGAGGEDRGWGIAVDGNGNAYVVGETSSSVETFPVMGSLQAPSDSGWNAFVAKVSAATLRPTVTPSPQPSATATATPTSSNRVLINELDVGTPDWIEFYNPENHVVDLSGWLLWVYRADGSLAYVYAFPAHVLSVDAYLVLREGSGTDTYAELYTGDGGIPWSNGSAGAMTLVNRSGVAVDFVRWQGCPAEPPEGTSWQGSVSTAPPVGSTLGRDPWSTDTDDAADWSNQAPSPGARNLLTHTCYGLDFTVNPVGAGYVEVLPGSNCWGGLYTAGTQITVTAHCAAGYVFARWTGSMDAETAVITLRLDGDKTLIAHFRALSRVQLWLPVIQRDCTWVLPVPTPTPHVTPYRVQLVVNPDLEEDAAWEIPQTEYRAGYSTARAYSGRRSMRLGIDTSENVYSYSSAQQVVEIPREATWATLSFHYYPYMSEADQDKIYFCVLRVEDDERLQTQVWQDWASGWQVRSFDLLAYAGRSVKIHFGVKNDGQGQPAAVYLDDVELWAGW